MRGCIANRATTSTNPTVAEIDALVFHVEDMTCGHCAGRITKAIQAGIPGAVVAADPASRTLGFTGTTDREAVRVLIAGAGYTPSEAAFA
jgi:copper chaperone